MDQGAGERTQDEGQQPGQEEDHDHVAEVRDQARYVAYDDEGGRDRRQDHKNGQPALQARRQKIRGRRLVVHRRDGTPRNSRWSGD